MILVKDIISFIGIIFLYKEEIRVNNIINYLDYELKECTERDSNYFTIEELHTVAEINKNKENGVVNFYEYLFQEMDRPQCNSQRYSTLKRIQYALNIKERKYKYVNRTADREFQRRL